MVYTVPSSLDSIQDVRWARKSTDEILVNWKDICDNDFHEQNEDAETFDCIEVCPHRPKSGLCAHPNHQGSLRKGRLDPYYTFNSKQKLLDIVTLLVEKEKFKDDLILNNAEQLYGYNSLADGIKAFKARGLRTIDPSEDIKPKNSILTSSGNFVPQFEDKLQFLLYRCWMIVDEPSQEEVFEALYNQIKYSLFARIYLLKQRVLEALDEIEKEMLQTPQPQPIEPDWTTYRNDMLCP